MALPEEGKEDMNEITPIPAWHEFVMMYTNRQLSYNTDILPALSGLAAEYLRKGGTGESYHAGLWRKTFVENLTWTANDDVKPSPYYRAPSWSWASVLGSVDYRESTHTWAKSAFDQDSPKLLEASCGMKGANPFGEVIDGLAVLEGSTHLCTLVLDGHDPSWDQMKKGIKISGLHTSTTVTFKPDVPLRPFEFVSKDGTKRRTASRQTQNPEGPALEFGFDCEVVALRLHNYEPSTIGAPAETLFMILGFLSLGLSDQELTGHKYERLGLLSAVPKAEVEFITRKMHIY